MSDLLNHIHTSIDMICAVVGVIVTIITVALPLSLNNVAEQLNEYRSKRVRNMFVNEPTYKAMLGSIILLVASLLFALLFKDKGSENLNDLLGGFCFLFALVSIGIFYFFIRRVNDYSVNTEEVVLKKHLDSYNKLSLNAYTYPKQIELIDGVANVVSQQIKKKNFDDAIQTSEELKDMVKRLFESIKGTDQQSYRILTDISKKYYDAVFEHWRDSFRNSSDAASRMIGKYNEVVAKTLSDKRVNKFDNPFTPLLLLYQRMAANLDESDKKVPFSAYYPWKWYFDILFNTKVVFDLSKVYLLNAYVIRSIKQDIDNGLDFVITTMIGHIIDSNLVWKHPNFSRFHDIEIDRKNERIEIDRKIERIEIDRKIKHIENGARKCFFLRELNNVIEEICALNVKEEDKEKIKDEVEKQFKYNNIQFVTLVLCAYCMDKGNYDLLKKVLEYNQPRFSYTKFCNKDIIPDTLQEVVEYYQRSSEQLIEYTTIWDNHFDIIAVFKYFLGLLSCWVYQKNTEGNNKLIIIPTGNKNELQRLTFVLEELKKLAKCLDNDVLENLGMNGDVKNGVVALFDQVIEEVNIAINECNISQKLDDKKVTDFVKSIVDNVRENPIWKKMLSQTCLSESREEKFEREVKKYGEQQKSFLAENDTGIFVGFPQGFSVPVIDEIDYKIERAIIAQSRLYPFDEFKVTESDFKEKLYRLSADAIVIFINYYHVYDMFIIDQTFVWSRGDDHTLIGNIENGATIRSVGDPQFHGARMIVIDKKDFSPVNIGITPDKVKVFDLNEDENKNKLEELVESKIKRGEYTEDKKDELKKHLRSYVRVEIDFSFSFQMRKDAKVLYLPLERQRN